MFVCMCVYITHTHTHTHTHTYKWIICYSACYCNYHISTCVWWLCHCSL